MNLSKIRAFAIRLFAAVAIFSITPAPSYAQRVTGEINSAIWVSNVKAFGAVGDGSTDDRAAIVAAYNAISATGGTIFFPQGTYRVSATITLSADTGIKIAGVGPSSVIRSAAANTCVFTGTGAGDLSINLIRTGGTGTNWQFYCPSGTNNFVFRGGSGPTDALTLDASANATFAGSIATRAPTGGAGVWELGVANVVSPTAPNRTVTIEIGGTTYYLAAKTTND